MRKRSAKILTSMIMAGLMLGASSSSANQASEAAPPHASAKSSQSDQHATFHVDVKGQGLPMILIPGLASSGEAWDSTVAHYAAHYQCHVLTLAGFAGQAPVKNFSLEGVSEDLSRYIAAQKLGRPVIVGHSLGGFLALALAAHHPEQVSKLVIVDALPALGAVQNPGATPQQLKEIGAKMLAGMVSMTEDQRLAMGRSAIATMATDQADVDRIFAWTKSSDWHTEAVATSELMGADLRQDVSKLNAPTLVLGTWIAYAAYATQAAVQHTFEEQYAKLPGVQIALASKARHFIMYDDPQWMFQQMDPFLNNISAKR